MDTEEIVDEAEIKEGFEVEGDEPIEDELPVEAIEDVLIIADDDGALGEKDDAESEDDELMAYMFGDDEYNAR